MLKNILHTGIAVPDLDEAIKLYQSLGFQISKQFHKDDINADIVMLSKGEATYELFKFYNEKHPQVQFIRNHIAIYSDALEEDLNQLLSKGYKLVIPITEGVVFRYAYLQDAAGINYEIATSKEASS